MNIFKKIVSSVYSPKFYSEISKSSFGSAIGYLSLVSLFLSIIYLVILMPTLLQSSGKVGQYISKLAGSYPENLQVVIKDGKVTTNVTEPYYIYSETGEKIGVIDTYTPYSAAKFAGYNVLFWVSKDSVFVKDSSGEIKVEDLSKISNLKIDKEAVGFVKSKIDPYVPFVNLVVCVAVFLGKFLASFGRLIYLSIFALIILLTLKIMKRDTNYAGAYKVGIYAMTLPFTIELILSIFKYKGFPFMFSLITLIVIIVNFTIQSKSEAKIVTDTQPVQTGSVSEKV